MSSSGLAISVRGLSKDYAIAHEEKHTTLGEKWMAKLRSPLSAFRAPARETFHALKDVSFDVKKGDVLGIIGRNGAGKSTLLKVLSRITEPTTGEVRLYGRVASLLEVGTGFHPELTGRENIYLNGAILGMKRAEITRKFDEIVAFAEVERFLDTPVKRYSSGMYVRLAFAVAAHLEPEILIVDEVLAVGDVEFQRKCLGKMKEVSEGGGRTVLFVSHNMAAVQSLCSTAMMITTGLITNAGVARDVVDAYLSRARSSTAETLGTRTDRRGSGEVRAHTVALLDNKGMLLSSLKPFQEFRVRLGVRADSPIRGVAVSIDLETTEGSRICSLYSGYQQVTFDLPGGCTSLVCDVPGLPLRPDLYRLHVWISRSEAALDFVEQAHLLNVEETDFYGTGRIPSRAHGPLLPTYRWSVEA